MNNKKITYKVKIADVCPLCSHSFHRKELLSGGGRLHVGSLDEELHRDFEVTENFGKIHPLIYGFVTCPECFFSCFTNDFSMAEFSDDIIEKLIKEKKAREKVANSLFNSIEFDGTYDLKQGITSGFLSMLCYPKFDFSQGSLYKSGLASLRTAWLMREFIKESNDFQFDYLARHCYQKTSYFFARALEEEKNGSLESIQRFGPDIDKDYSYSGFLYLSVYLNFKYNLPEDPLLKQEKIEEYVILLSKIVDVGKIDKLKPTPLLERVKALFYEINSLK